MSIHIRSYRPEDVLQVRAFNVRLRAGQSEFIFPEESVARDSRQQFFLALEDASEPQVRGGYILKNETFFSGYLSSAAGNAQSFAIGNYQLPLSEGTVDRRFALLGLQLLQDVLEREKHLYCLGMGGTERPLPRLLKKRGWDVALLPFFFKVLHAQRFLAGIRFLRERPKWRAVLDGLRYSGVGALGVALLKAATAFVPRKADVQVRVVDSFPPACDELFTKVLATGVAMCDRRVAALAQRFPAHDKRFTRVVMEKDGVLRGWALLSFSELQDHKQFGNLRLGTVVDLLAEAGFESTLLFECEKVLQNLGADLIVSNQSHKHWQQAFRQRNFLRGPSNFALARSPALHARCPAMDETHFNRGDGDGPINL